MLRGRAQQERELRLPGTALQLLADLAQGIGHAGQGGERLLHTAMHARAVRRRRVRRHACNCRPPIHTVAAMAAHLMAPRHDPATALARRASATFQPGATSAPASISRPCSAGMSWGHQGGIPPIQTIRAGLAVSSARKGPAHRGCRLPTRPRPVCQRRRHARPRSPWRLYPRGKHPRKARPRARSHGSPRDRSRRAALPNRLLHQGPAVGCARQP